MNQGVNFLKDGKHLKLTLTFGKGREMLTKEERGPAFFAKVDQFLTEADFGGNLMQEKEQQAGHIWSRIYYLKNK